MQRTILGYILRYSAFQQIFVVAITLASLPFYYASLDLPKKIINRAIDAEPATFPRQLRLLGFDLVSLSQLESLVALTGIFLVVVLINGGFKYAINLYKGLIGERLLRRLRYQLYERILRFPLARFRKVSQGEMVSMMSSETAPLGGYIGDSFSLPVYQGGLLLTVLGFIVVQNPLMGLAVVALYPIQLAVIPRLQSEVNQLEKKRVKELRNFSARIAESIDLAAQVRINNTGRYELARISETLGRIFSIRYDIFKKKFLVKFLNDFLTQLTPFLFFLIGGYLVINRELSLGALIAVLAAYKDLSKPWKELLGYYQDQQDARIRYEQIIAQFDPPGLRPTESEEGAVSSAAFPEGELAFESVSGYDDGILRVSEVTGTIGQGEHVAILGVEESGKEYLALLIAGLATPSSGRITIGGRSIQEIPLGIAGRSISYVDGNPCLFRGSILDNVIYSLKHKPGDATLASVPHAAGNRDWRTEAAASGNSIDDFGADWNDYLPFGGESPKELGAHVVRTLGLVNIRDSLVAFGLRTRIDPDSDPDLAATVLELRSSIFAKIQDGSLRRFIEPFDETSFNAGLSIGENLLFGVPIGGGLDPSRLASYGFVRSILKNEGLEGDLIKLGLGIANKAAELSLGDIRASEIADHHLPIEESDLPRLKIIAGLAHRKDVEDLGRNDRRLLESLALRLIASQHREPLIGEVLHSKIVAARKRLRGKISAKYRNQIAFFDRQLYNPALTIRENVMFGEIADDAPEARNRVDAEIIAAVEDLGVRPMLERAGLFFDVGTGGAELTRAERQKVALARALIKGPRILIMNGATTDLDPASEEKIIRGIRQSLQGRFVICMCANSTTANLFDRSLELRIGRLVDPGGGMSRTGLQSE